MYDKKTSTNQNILGKTHNNHIIEFTQSLVSVSYTHLDVYKRQVYGYTCSI